MSDVMLLGVLRMPIEYVGGPMSPMAQLVSRAREAADRIESDAAEIERLRAQVAELSAPAEAVQTDWRKLALQFDAQRMSALWHIKALLQDPQGHADKAREFLSAAPAAPAGWQWVPKEPTLAMLDALRADTTMYLPARYAAMLAAAPGAQGDAS